MVLDSNGDPASGKTITYKVYDEADGQFATDSMTEIGSTAIYTASWTPDANGEWTFYAYSSDPKFHKVLTYFVGKAIESDLITRTKGLDDIHDDLVIVLADTNELQADWADGGRLDLLVDAIKAESESHPTLAEIEASTVLTLKAHLVHGTGDITPPTNKGIWDYLPYLTGDAYVRLGAPVGASISADIAAIKTEIDHGTYGLSAIEALVDEAESLLKNGTYGLSALDTDLGTLLTRLTAARAGYLDNLSAGAIALASVCTEARLSKLDATISSRAPESGGNVAAILTDTQDIQPRVPRIVCHMDFWSDNDDEITLTTTSSSYNLPNCVVAGLPSGVTLIRVVALLKIALLKDTSGADNAVNIATMALKVDAASDYSSTVTAIDIPDNSWALDVSEATERGGDVMIGDNDIKAEVTGNATFYARFETAKCDGNNLKLKDIAWGLRIYFTV